MKAGGMKGVAKDLRQIQRWLRSTELAPIPEDGLFYQNLHEKVMASLSLESEADHGPSSVPTSSRRMRWSTLTITLALSFLMSMDMAREQTLSRDPANQISSITHGEVHSLFSQLESLPPAVLSQSLLGLEGESELVSEVFSRMIKRLGPEDTNRLLRRIRE